MIKELVLAGTLVSQSILPQYYTKAEKPMDAISLKMMEINAKSGNFEAGRNTAHLFMKNNPIDPAGYFYKGYMEYRLNNKDEARKYFKSSNSIKEKPITYFYLGETYFDNCVENNIDCTMAELHYKKAFNMDMEQTNALLRLQVVTDKQGKKEESQGYADLYKVLRPKH